MKLFHTSKLFIIIKKLITNMLIYKPTGESFKDRKEAKEKLGHYTYNKAVREKTITFHDDIDIYKKSDVII